jgi:tRNA G10  N-methylase Trm11
MHIALLGRQPALSIAELERTFERVSWFSADTALVDTKHIDVQKLGGTQKAGKVAFELNTSDWRRISDAIVAHYSKKWNGYDGKITLGLSAYGVNVSVRDLQKVGLILKGKLKKNGTSIRLIPNQEIALSSATSHHNKLGLSDNKVELMIVKGGKSIVVAESTGAQNITALAARDQGRPKRDAFVGMLPPKLAQIMINLAGEITKDPESDLTQPRILDPFCGTGVLLQEATLMNYAVYGTDIAEKMIRFSRDNLNWLQSTYNFTTSWYLHEGDAVDTKWQQPIDAVVSESYLGQPFSAPPSSAKLTEVKGNCNHIISGFLRNLQTQLKPGTPVVLAVPAWKDKEGRFTHLPLIDRLDELGFEQVKFQTVPTEQLLYHRPDQVVARELLVLTRI